MMVIREFENSVVNTNHHKSFMSSENRQACPTELPAFCQQRHWSIYWILIACAMAMVAGRIATVKNHAASTPEASTPFFSANDRSRWAAVRAMVDEKQFHIDDVIERGQMIHWDTIDKVQHLDAEGNMRSYSSKPPLLAMLVAAGYTAVKTLTGLTITTDTVTVTRILLLMFNGVFMFVLLFYLAKTIDCIRVRDWSRYYVLAFAGFGTFLTTYAVSLNNHLPAAAATMVTVYCLTKILRPANTLLPRAHWGTFLLAGLASAFAFASELPALSLVGITAAVCLLKSPRHMLTGFLPGALLVIAVFLGTNFMVHGQWKMPYMQRGDGEVIGKIAPDSMAALTRVLDDGQWPDDLNKLLPEPLQFKVAAVTKGDWPSTDPEVERWIVRDKFSDLQFVVRNENVNVNDDQGDFSIRRWGNWYEYPDSYWLKSNFERKSLVDRGQPDQMVYAFHVLLGHHGIVSLTPVWVLALAGMIVLLLAGRYELRLFGVIAILLTAVVLAFYIARPTVDRNYGGVTSGLRWVFWLYPIWLVCLLPMADSLSQSKFGRAVCLILLVISIASVSWSNLDPWVDPWLYQLWPVTGLPS